MRSVVAGCRLTTSSSSPHQVRSALEQVIARGGKPLIIANDTDRSLDDNK